MTCVYRDEEIICKKRKQPDSRATMAPDDFCRLCKTNLREGPPSAYAHSTDMFAMKKETTISDRLAFLGVIVSSVSGQSRRCCSRCASAINRLEKDLPLFRQWEEEFQDSNVSKRPREPTPSTTPRDLKKTCPNPPTPSASSAVKPTATTTQVTIKYPSQTMTRVCEPEEDPIVKFLALKRWKEAASHALKHQHLREEIKDGLLNLIRKECEALCSRKNDFILWKSKQADLKSFSFISLRDDLHRLAPFLLKMFNCISNDNNFAACTAAAIAIRGRQPRMAALSYWINTILQYGGAKKSVFNRLSQLSITTSHKRAVKKQQELALACPAIRKECARQHGYSQTPQELEPSSEGKEGKQKPKKKWKDEMEEVEVEVEVEVQQKPKRKKKCAKNTGEHAEKSRDTPSKSSAVLDRSGLMEEVVVKVACLLELFQNCFGCYSDACSVTTQRKGLVFQVVQQCWSCGKTRNWTSHPPDHQAPDPTASHDAYQESEPSPEDVEELELVEEEEEEEEEEEKRRPKRKRKDSDEDWGLSSEELAETSSEESEGVDEGEEHVLQVAWCCDCGEEASARCFKQKHLQLYCCVKCGYRDGDQELDSTGGQQTQHSCDGSQAAELSEANSNKKQTASEDSNSISNQGVINCDKLHKSRNCNQGSVSKDGAELSRSSSDNSHGVFREQFSVCSSDQGTRNESPEDTTSRDQGSNTSSQVKSSNSCHQETSAANEERLRLQKDPPKYAVYFNDPHSLQIHLEEVHGEKRELCPDCGKFLIRRDGRTKHVCDHKVKPLSCLVCGKRCVNEAGLRRHSHVHTDDRGLACQYCCKTFRFLKDKQEHEETHKGESLKFRCSECPKRFADCPSRSTHRKTHWERGRFFCKVCDKGFPQAHHLQRHMAVHTGQKPFRCKLCDCSFNQSGHLKSHMRLHTGERPFKCQDCGQCFNHNVSLKNHIQRKHTPGAEGR